MLDVFEEARKKLMIERKFDTKFDENTPTARIDISTFKIYVNPKFWDMLDENGKRGIAGHEIGHYKYMPFDLKNQILLMFAASRKMPNESKEEVHNVINWFEDMIVNIRASEKIEEIANSYKQIGASSTLERILDTYYSELTNLDFGKYQLNKDEKKLLQELYCINPFADKDKLINYELPKFIEVYKKLREKMPMPSLSEILMGDKTEVEGVIRRLIKEGKIRKEDIKNIPKLFPYVASNTIEANKYYYKSKSLAYSLNIEPIPIESNGGSYPVSHKKWSPSDPIMSVDPFTSFGKLALPPLTNKWVYDSYNTYGKRKELPPALIVLDSSGSMPNPVEKDSPAVIASYVVARKYLTQGSKVGVINFSNETCVWDWTHNLSDIENGLVKYQGGGTYLDVEKLKKVDKTKADLYLITDVGLNEKSNLEELLGYLNSREGRNLVFWIKGDNPSDLNEIISKYQKIKFVEVTDPSSLPKIIVKSG